MKVTLRNVKRIRELPFELPGVGVWIVTGLNGSGKTSLFAAIYRIGAQHAFQRYYRTSPLERRIDSYADAEIEYSISGNSVKYRYGGQRWRATPRRNANLLADFPFASVEFVEANGERIEPFADEIQARRLKIAPPDIRSFMTEVLADAKWNDLKYVNTRRGIGSDAYIIPYQDSGKTYYFSEKSFSLGELCVLKLAKKIVSAPDTSLVLIDEVEMALHPQAQVRLLLKITEIANKKNLTVLFSTHSATLIKNAHKKNLILLKARSDGTVTTTRSPFPAQILGDIAFDDELTTDFILFVEDKQAKLLTEQLVNIYMAHCHPENRHQPLLKVVPVGGFPQVLEMLATSSGIFPSYVKRFALLDEDVKTESLTAARKNDDRVLLDLFARTSDYVHFLPCTPEVGVIELLEMHAKNDADLLDSLSCAFNGHRININQIITSHDYKLLTQTNPRNRAKSRLAHFVQAVANSTNIDHTQVQRVLFAAYANHKYINKIGQLRQLLGPIFNAR